MDTKRFNPFEDRLSRDIRNELSESIIEVLATRSLAPAEAAAAHYLTAELPDVHRAYIVERLTRYEKAISALPHDSAPVLETAAILWDLQLFFEVHEILEPAWMASSGDDKLILQALIRAAGVNINLELGYNERAAKIAGKTIPVLRMFSNRLQSIAVDSLIAALEQLSFPPPRLGPE